jgi:hypothetical protein
MSDTDTTTPVGSIPPPGTPFSAPPPPQNGSQDEALVDELLNPPVSSEATFAEPANTPPQETPELDPRGAGRDLTLALRGIEEIDMRLVTMQAQLAMCVAVAIVLTGVLITIETRRARGSK